MVERAILIAIAAVGWWLALYGFIRWGRLGAWISNLLTEVPVRFTWKENFREPITLLTTSRYEGETLNGLLHLCHVQLHATAVELTTTPDSNDKNSSTSVRLTSGRPVSRAAHAFPLRLGKITIGQLRYDAPELGAPQQRILERIAQAITLQLVAQRTGRELRQLAGAENESERARMGFVASLSHEVRGPLGMVLNAVELVRDELCGPVTADQRETLGLVHGNVKHLLSLVNDVLDFAKTESGNVIPKRESIALKPLLEELVGSARGQADAKHQKLSLRVADDVTGLFDERHLRQVVLNLLTNATKYTPDKGEIIVEVTKQAGQVTIAVKDSGVGIPESEHHKVFTPFERVSTGLNQQGTGLGMPLSKLLAEKNGGSLSFVSQVGVGSTFSLSLDCGAPRIDVSEQSAEPALTVSLKGESLLLASRDSDQINVLSRALGALDASVSRITSEQRDEDRSIGEAPPVTAIIIDSTVVTPEDEIGSWVKFANKHKVPLVMLTPRAFEFDTAEYLKSGVDVCVAKPFKTSDLAQTLKRLRSIPS